VGDSNGAFLIALQVEISINYHFLN